MTHLSESAPLQPDRTLTGAVLDSSVWVLEGLRWSHIREGSFRKRIGDDKQGMSSLPRLMVVMPVFNEGASVEKVVGDWFQKLEEVVGDFVIHAIDDGSTDDTVKCLERLRNEFGVRFEFQSRENRGHGQSCMEGYRIARERGIAWVFQIDSDGQCDPQYFREFWEIRDEYDVIYGKRTRADGFRRVLASRVLRVLLRVIGKVDCVDSNVPYRLMRTESCGPMFDRVPGSFFLANVALAVVLRRSSGLRHGAVPIGFLPRYGGEPTVPFSKFALKAVELFRQLGDLEND